MRPNINALLLFLTICAAQGFAQNPPRVVFTYDAAGNRILREIYLGKSAEANPIDSLQADSQRLQPLTDILGGLEITIFPNPVTSELNLQVKNLAESTYATIEVYSTLGKKLGLSNRLLENMQLQFGNYPSGSYILRVVHGNEHKEWTVVKL